MAQVPGFLSPTWETWLDFTLCKLCGNSVKKKKKGYSIYSAKNYSKKVK